MGDLSRSKEAKKRGDQEGRRCMLEERARARREREREREYTWVDVFVVLDSGDGGGRRTWWWRNAVSSFFCFSGERA